MVSGGIDSSSTSIFVQNDVWEIQPYWPIAQFFSHFYHFVIFHCVKCHNLFIHSAIDRNMSCSHFPLHKMLLWIFLMCAYLHLLVKFILPPAAEQSFCCPMMSSHSLDVMQILILIGIFNSSFPLNNLSPLSHYLITYL